MTKSAPRSGTRDVIDTAPTEALAARFAPPIMFRHVRARSWGQPHGPHLQTERSLEVLARESWMSSGTGLSANMCGPRIQEWRVGLTMLHVSASRRAHLTIGAQPSPILGMGLGIRDRKVGETVESRVKAPELRRVSMLGHDVRRGCHLLAPPLAAAIGACVKKLAVRSRKGIAPLVQRRRTR